MSHVVSNMIAENMVPVNLSVQLLLFIVIPRESLDGVRNIQTSINSSFHRGEHLSTGGGTCKANVQTAPK